MHKRKPGQQHKGWKAAARQRHVIGNESFQVVPPAGMAKLAASIANPPKPTEALKRLMRPVPASPNSGI